MPGLILKCSLEVYASRRESSTSVEATDRHAATDLPQVRSDDDAIGRVAAEHLLERSVRRFAFCGFAIEARSTRREIGFVQKLSDVMNVTRYDSPWHGRGAKSWEDEKDALAEWLKTFSPPIENHGLQ